MSYLYLPFILQGILMGIDESFHRKRGLGLWERVGHPLDTLTVLLPLSYIALNEFSDKRLTLFIVLSVFSCFFITKDEFIHYKECTPVEHWLHAVLFILHPMIFLASGIIWIHFPDDKFLSYQAILIGIFMLYQIFKWSMTWKQQVK